MRQNALDFKPEMFSAIMTTWMLAAVSCAALPFLHAVPRLQTAGQLTTLLVALAIGVAAGVPLSVASRQLCHLGARTKHSWGSFAPREAALLGVVGWGLPVGLIFALHEFLASSSALVVLPSLAIWPFAGVAFGLAMRWLARRGHEGSHQA